MQKDLEMLLKLEDIDYELGELERSKYYLPEMIENLEKEIEDTGNTLKQAEEELTEKNLRRKKLEMEVETAQSELAKFDKQMRVIKTNREYDALTTEIANRKLKIAENEEEILGLMTQIDELEEKISEYKQKFKEVSEDNRAQLKNLRKEIDSIEDKVKVKKDERKNVIVRINKTAVATYERVKKGKAGKAVVVIRKRACSGCYKSLPPQRIQEIKKGDSIITCDNCGRILVWMDEE